jgi:lipase
MTALHVHEFGDPDGVPVLTVHGVTAHGRRFRRLAEEGWPERRTIAVDLRGHGHSLWDGPWNVAQHVDDLIDTLDVLDVATCDVVGHSYGGMIALALLARAPERVRSLAMLDPALQLATETERSMAETTIADPGFATVADATTWRQGGNDAIADAVAIEIDDHLTRDDAGRYRFRFSRPAAIAAWGEMRAPLPSTVAATPALLVVATQAPFVTPAVQSALVALFGDHLTTVRIDCGHMLYWERFDETAAAVRAFLSA